MTSFGIEKKVLLATGVPDFDESIKNQIDSVDFVGTVLYREGLVDAIKRKKPDIVVICNLLEGMKDVREMIIDIRTTFPEVRVIYIFSEEDLKLKGFLYHWMIFDVFVGNFSVKSLEENFFNKKEFKDIVQEYEGIKKNPTTEEEPNIDGFSGISGGGYQKLDSPTLGTSSLYQEIVSFWAVSDQSGKTTSACNVALRIASKPELKVLLMDFSSSNPNVQLQFGFSDPDRNLGAIVEDVENGLELDEYNIEDYLYTHPVYKNLSILSGNILKMKNKNSDFMIKIFNKILEITQKKNYSTILIDTDSGVRDDLTVHILQQSNKILLHVKESPSSLYAARRFFDTEVGPFVEKLIDRKKVLGIITFSHEDKLSNFSRAFTASTEIRVGLSIPENVMFLDTLFEGSPILSKEHPIEIYNLFLLMSNIIHQKLFIPPSSTKKGNKNKNKKVDKKSSFFNFRKNEDE